MDIFSFTYIIFSFQTLEFITALRASVTAIASTINSTCNRVPELRPISTRVIVPIFMIPPRPLPNQNSYFIISPAMARARRTNNRVIARGKRRHFVIELKLKRKGKRKTSLYIYKFLSKKFSNYSFNILRKKIYPNFLIKKNVQLLIRILFREKFIQYTSEKNSSEFYFAKKYSDYLLVLRRHVLCETFY